MADTPTDQRTDVALEGTARAFADYCAAEFDRRRNATETFAEADYHEAMEMVLARLAALAAEGRV